MKRKEKKEEEMERYYRKKYIKRKEKEEDISMHIIEWWAEDEYSENEEEESVEECVYCGKGEEYCKCNTAKYVIRCFGVNEEGESIMCKITGYKPEFYIKVNDKFDNVRLGYFIEWISESYYNRKYPEALEKRECKIVRRKDIYGFRNNKEYKFVKLVFNNYTALKRMKYLFKKPVCINRVNTKAVKYKVYESNFEGFMRFCHKKDIYMAGWIRLRKGEYKVTNDTARTTVEYSIEYDKVESLKEKTEMGNFLQASFDIETYSYDMAFPDPNKIFIINGIKRKPNEIFQIATTYKYYKDSDILIKHLLTLKRCDKIEDPRVIVEECKDERELLKRWVEIIYNMDPDIMYTYNGDSFDCKYIVERAKIYNIEEYIYNMLSRLEYTKGYMKEETFSSSAYGDSEYYRLYIPGRLNYDLLIHYQRGMKKYSSYKLDYIANEIIGEGKHDLDAKTMFRYYAEGRADRIKKIGEYCLMDTELLQRLVDKQLILINIMQLANVTYVPIKYLTTRGQTIKVFSQILRKARQMNYLVPDTNFNEDTYPITIKFYESHNIKESDISEYIEIKNMGSEMNREKSISCKITEIIDDKTIIVVTDTEIKKEYYNKTIRYKYSNYKSSRLYPNDEEISDTFSGAYVLEADKNLHSDNICILDFASLYPTIMIAWNLCYSTFVRDEKYLNIEGVKYERLKWNDKVVYKMNHTCDTIMPTGLRKGEICGKQAYFEIEGQYKCKVHDKNKKTRRPDEKEAKREVSYDYTIVQPHIDKDGEVVNKGVLPALLEELYAERKSVKKRMAKAKMEGNKLLENILDSTQLSIKISLNSCYGFLGRKQGNLILKELGSIVTSNGRKLLDKTKTYAENEFIEYVNKNELIKERIKEVKIEMSEEERKKYLEEYCIKNEKNEMCKK